MNWVWRAIYGAVILVALGVLAWLGRNWLYYHAGLNSGNSSWYLLPSGWGSILIPPLITLAGIVALWWWHHLCVVTGCYWPAKRLTAANELACWRHHPHKKRTERDVHAAHHAVLLGRHPK